MYILKPLAILIVVAITTSLFASDSSCNDSQYQAHLEDLDCSLVLSEFAEFLTEADTQLKRNVPFRSPNRASLLVMLEQFSSEEEALGNCLVKQGDPDTPQPIREIYTNASIAAMALRAWIESRPADARMRTRAMSKFQDLVATMRNYEHNNAFNADAAKSCAG